MQLKTTQNTKTCSYIIIKPNIRPTAIQRRMIASGKVAVVRPTKQPIKHSQPLPTQTPRVKCGVRVKTRESAAKSDPKAILKKFAAKSNFKPNKFWQQRRKQGYKSPQAYYKARKAWKVARQRRKTKPVRKPIVRTKPIIPKFNATVKKLAPKPQSSATKSTNVKKPPPVKREETLEELEERLSRVPRPDLLTQYRTGISIPLTPEQEEVNAFMLKYGRNPGSKDDYDFTAPTPEPKRRAGWTSAGMTRVQRASRYGVRGPNYVDPLTKLYLKPTQSLPERTGSDKFAIIIPSGEGKTFLAKRGVDAKFPDMFFDYDDKDTLPLVDTTVMVGAAYMSKRIPDWSRIGDRVLLCRTLRQVPAGFDVLGAYALCDCIRPTHPHTDSLLLKRKVALRYSIADREELPAGTICCKDHQQRNELIRRAIVDSGVFKKFTDVMLLEFVQKEQAKREARMMAADIEGTSSESTSKLPPMPGHETSPPLPKAADVLREYERKHSSLWKNLKSYFN